MNVVFNVYNMEAILSSVCKSWTNVVSAVYAMEEIRNVVFTVYTVHCTLETIDGADENRVWQR